MPNIKGELNMWHNHDSDPAQYLVMAIIALLALVGADIRHQPLAT
jgi:hypothetical protein